jgi:acetoin utilization deacetylase AcuC-like enzyme
MKIIRHHAGKDYMGGYCYLNNAAIAAKEIVNQMQPIANSPPQKHVVTILDLDYHMGNGTQDIFYSSNEVQYISLHGHPDDEYPYYLGYENERGEGEGEGWNSNYPLPIYTDDDQYFNALSDALEKIRLFNPQYLVISFGADTSITDPLGCFKITMEGYQKMAKTVAQLGLPTVIVLEGGYAQEELGQIVTTFLRPFIHTK